MSADFFNGCDRLLSATANGVYQGILVAALTALALRLFVRTNAATRHAVWFGILLFVAALIPAHLLLSSHAHSEIPANPANPAVSATPVSSGPAHTPNIGRWPLADSDPAPQREEFDSSEIGGVPPFPIADAQSYALTSGAEPETPPLRTKENQPISALKSLASFASRLTSPIHLPQWVSLSLVSAWALLAAIRLGQIALRIAEVRRARTTSRPPNNGLQGLFGDLRDSLSKRRNVQLRISDDHRSPVLLGFLHPVVLLPAEMDYEDIDTELEHVLRHELAHVERCDDWGNLTQQLLQAALFFHPAVWWISSKLSLEREFACDDFVLEASGRPRAYATTLANIASRLNHCRHLLAPGVSNNNSQLQQRITMILNTQRDRSSRLAARWLGLFTAASAALAVIAIDAGPRLVLAQTPAAEAEAATPAEAAEPPEPAVPPEPADVAQTAVPAQLTITPSQVTASPDTIDGIPGHPMVLVAAPAAGSAIWSGEESGPKPKAPAGADNSAPAVPAPAALPEPPAGPPIRVHLSTPVTVSAFGLVSEAPEPPEAPEAPEPPDAPDSDAHPKPRPGKRHMSVEERLDRIEKTLSELKAHGRDNLSLFRGSDGKGMSYGWVGNPNFDFTSKDVAEKFDKMSKDQARALESAQERIAEEASRTAEQAVRAEEAGKRAAEQATRAMEQGQRAMEKAQRDFEKQNHWQGDVRGGDLESSQKAIQALREARESLESQLKTLEHQIKRLEEDRDHMKKTGKQDPFDQGSKDETSSSGKSS